MVRVKDKYINPFTDFGFKKLFGTELNKDLLMDFLNELLPSEAGQIQCLRFLEKEQLGRRVDERKAIFDIIVKIKWAKNSLLKCKKPNKIILKTEASIIRPFPFNNKPSKGIGISNSKRYIRSEF
jgi:hypothetical protein